VQTPSLRGVVESLMSVVFAKDVDMNLEYKLENKSDEHYVLRPTTMRRKFISIYVYICSGQL
jgi:hypothetical protein